MLCKPFLTAILMTLLAANSIFATSLNLFGGTNALNIRRSDAGNWSSNSPMTLVAENTDATFHKIIVSGTLSDPADWQQRYLRVRVEIPLTWLAISPTAFSIQREVVTNGVLNAPSDIVRNLDTGNYPAADFYIEGRADRGAIPGDASLTISVTIVEQ